MLNKHSKLASRCFVPAPPVDPRFDYVNELVSFYGCNSAVVNRG